jgi:hypothetical protein
MKTKNIVLTAMVGALALVMSFNTQAQQKNAWSQEKVWSIGPEAGTSFSRYGMDAATNDTKAGFVGGFFVTYSIVNTFGLTTKFLYTEKGAEINSTNTKQTLRYFEVPVIGRFFLNKEGNFRPNIFLGPSFGFLTGAKQKVGDGENQEIDSFENVYKRADIGITGGIGLNFRIYNETYFILDTRFTHGLSDITKADSKINNNTLAVTAGVSFGF